MFNKEFARSNAQGDWSALYNCVCVIADVFVYVCVAIWLS